MYRKIFVNTEIWDPQMLFYTIYIWIFLLQFKIHTWLLQSRLSLSLVHRVEGIKYQLFYLRVSSAFLTNLCFRQFRVLLLTSKNTYPILVGRINKREQKKVSFCLHCALTLRKDPVTFRPGSSIPRSPTWSISFRILMNQFCSRSGVYDQSTLLYFGLPRLFISPLLKNSLDFVIFLVLPLISDR